ncbi:hypothetical protein AB6T85_08865 [Erwinia sp. ACCC 02193]|jgi:hypothetical protein|uniref:Uncharacterized protein n=1 Tax=Erwinia aeris TaxID=3239803 RepID=A0ABV4E6K7_9GAMM
MKKTFINGLAALFFCSVTMTACAADDTTLNCKNSSTITALNLKTLGLKLSADTPVDTVIYSGKMGVKFNCALDQLKQYGQDAEVYFKRNAAGELGYGLTIYVGYGDTEPGAAPVNIPTGKKVSTYAYTSGGTVGTYTEVELSVPFKIVRTAMSTAPYSALRNYVNPFAVGSKIPGTDLQFQVNNIKKAITLE